MAEEVDDPLIGRVLNGRFRILAPLGAGGMGRVYKALQHPLERIVALKVLHPAVQGGKDLGFERRFFLEASMTAKLKHANTVTVHDYGRTDDGVFFLAMEYIDGATLHQVLRGGSISRTRALGIAAQVARSLREAHKLGLVHRDLKPGNVMLLRETTEGDVVKVLDFGLVKCVTPEALQNADPAEVTQAGILVGSPTYMAPEQARNEADHRTDIYSLGVLLYQCLAGRPPFAAKEFMDLIVQHMKDKPPSLRTLVPDLPLEVEALVMRCLEKRPEDRFQSMDELLDAMRVAAVGQGISGVFRDPRTSGLATPEPRLFPPPLPIARPVDASPAPAPEVARPRRSHLPLILISVAGVLCGALLAFKLLLPADRQPPPVVPTPAALPEPAPQPADPAPTPTEPPAKPPPSPVQVTFDVQSDPTGAEVTRDGVPVGATPLKLVVTRDGEQSARLDLGFSLAGYQSTSTVVEGREGTVPVKQALKRLAPKPTKPTGKKPDGYKDDPYQ